MCEDNEFLFITFNSAILEYNYLDNESESLFQLISFTFQITVPSSN